METTALLAAFGQTASTEAKSTSAPTASQTPALAPGDKRRAIGIVAALALMNAAAWSILAFLVTHYPTLSAGGTLAYTFGLRHAVDADHIAAIDNVTRKLMSTPTPATSATTTAKPAPLLVGLFFSLGHSTVVCLMCLFIALGSQYLSSNVSNIKAVLAPVGTFVSVFILLLVAVLNLATTKDLYVQYHECRATGEHKHYSTQPP